MSVAPKKSFDKRIYYKSTKVEESSIFYFNENRVERPGIEMCNRLDIRNF